MTADFPDDATGDALRRLARDGTDLSKPLVMDFQVAVPDQAVGEVFAVRARELGFDAEVEQDPEDLQWTCYCKQELLATYEVVTGIERALDELARPLGGHVDGFGSWGNKTSAANMTTLVDCCIHYALAADVQVPSRAACHEMLADLLREQEVVEAVTQGITTRTEARDVVLANIQTFLERTSGRAIALVTGDDLETRVEAGLFDG